MSNAELWQDIRRLAEHVYPNAAKTTLLGWVRRTWKNGVLVNEIPEWIERDAAAHGLEVTSAHWETNTYYLRLKDKEAS